MTTYSEKLIKLQQDVLGATKHAIQSNAPGLPVAALCQFVRKVGGDILLVDKEMDIEEFEDKNPFRLCVTSKEAIHIAEGQRLTVVDEVIGWG